MWTVGVGPCTETTSCYGDLSCLACLSIGGYTADVVGGLLDFKDVCRATSRTTTVVALIIAIAVPACDMHSCMISFDLWVQRYHFKTIIYGRQKSVDSDELWKSSQILMRTQNP